jgi:hypothetical protein
MIASTQVICSCALTFGVPIVLAGWELWRMGPTVRRLPPGDDMPPDPSPMPDAGVSPATRKPLPDCLIPRPAPVREHELA